MPNSTTTLSNPVDSRRFISRKEAAALLSISEQLVDRWIREGKIRGFRLGRRVVLAVEELLHFVEQNQL